VHNLTYGRQNNLFLICKRTLTHTLPISDRSAVAPKETDEYKHEELGSWKHELRWQRRAFADDPSWYLNRLMWLFALAWLVSLVPGTLEIFAAAVVALVAIVRWSRESLLALPEHARTRSF
jgi:hypothetical protein